MKANISKEAKLQFLDDYFVSTKEAVDMLQISKQNFYSLVNRNKIERVNKSGVVLYFKDEIKERLNSQGDLRYKYRPFDYRK
ncbi:helix-turn-helix domain-containing protein [Listeria newyorkensis]|uniref:Helix-turn-helix domain-containing protein n=1 Tax=Listeria newyorkensis TaxID=1497681 RepID=A0A841YWY5_9LIST|nr:helix-turn-helix domain-containing protein [Listeria newyorkensis]MBC1457808.1 helix-turn-helix domain-containing protein [Listeria newyorkensis]